MGALRQLLCLKVSLCCPGLGSWSTSPLVMQQAMHRCMHRLQQPAALLQHAVWRLMMQPCVTAAVVCASCLCQQFLQRQQAKLGSNSVALFCLAPLLFKRPSLLPPAFVSECVFVCQCSCEARCPAHFVNRHLHPQTFVRDTALTSCTWHHYVHTCSPSKIGGVIVLCMCSCTGCHDGCQCACTQACSRASTKHHCCLQWTFCYGVLAMATSLFTTVHVSILA